MDRFRAAEWRRLYKNRDNIPKDVVNAKAALRQVRKEKVRAGAHLDDFDVSSFSVLDARNKKWDDRKQLWLSRGVVTRLARPLKGAMGEIDESELRDEYGGPVSAFNPALAELMVQWFTKPGWLVLDPFAGASTRGLVAAVLGRKYYGIDIHPKQVEENKSVILRQVSAGFSPTWVTGDSRTEVTSAPEPVFISAARLTGTAKYTQTTHAICRLCRSWTTTVRH